MKNSYYERWIGLLFESVAARRWKVFVGLVLGLACLIGIGAVVDVWLPFNGPVLALRSFLALAGGVVLWSLRTCASVAIQLRFPGAFKVTSAVSLQHRKMIAVIVASVLLGCSIITPMGPYFTALSVLIAWGVVEIYGWIQPSSQEQFIEGLY